MAFEKTTVKIASATPGWDLDTWCYLPTSKAGDTKPKPVIIMAHGFSANKLMGLSTYAEAFASLGYASLVFDYRHWGASDGKPRHLLRVNDQLEDYRTVIKYARQQPEFDPARIVLWGSSFSGGHVITLSAEPSIGPVAAIAQCPYTAGPPPIAFSLGVVKTAIYALIDPVKRLLGMDPVYIPAAASPGQVGGLTAKGTMEGLMALAQDSSEYPNEVNAGALLQVFSYQPVHSASAITCPIILVAPEDDNLCLLPSAIAVADAAKKSELVKLPLGHFDVYPGRPQHQASLDAQLAFLNKHVPL